MSVNGSWIDNRGRNYKTDLLNDIKIVKGFQEKGYFVSYDLDKLYEIVKNCSTPSRAVKEVRKAFGFGPSVKRDYFSTCEGIFSMIDYMPETVEALESDEKLLKLIQYFQEHSYDD